MRETVKLLDWLGNDSAIVEERIAGVFRSDARDGSYVRRGDLSVPAEPVPEAEGGGRVPGHHGIPLHQVRPPSDSKCKYSFQLRLGGFCLTLVSHWNN